MFIVPLTPIFWCGAISLCFDENIKESIPSKNRHLLKEKKITITIIIIIKIIILLLLLLLLLLFLSLLFINIISM